MYFLGGSGRMRRGRSEEKVYVCGGLEGRRGDGFVSDLLG